MLVDLSIYENVDFTNIDSLIFLVIIFVIAVAAVSIFIILVIKLFKLLKNLINKIFVNYSQRTKLKKNKHNQTTDTQEMKGAVVAQKQGVTGGDYLNNGLNNKNKIEDKAKSDIESREASGRLIHSQESKEAGNVPMQKSGGVSDFKIGEKKVEGQADPRESYKNKENKSISEHLGKLKADQNEKKDTLASKMPSRSEIKEEGLNSDKIKIATKKVFPAVGAPVVSSAFEPKSMVQNQKNNAAKIEVDSVDKGKLTTNKDSSPLEKPDIMQDKLGIGASRKALTKKVKESQGPSSPMFGKADEVSRKELRYKLLKDPKIWKAQKDLRMNLSPVQRMKLEKENFPSVYGRDISKRDLKTNIKRMGKEWVNTSDAKKKELLRKEIKFFKKIGGIK